MSTAALTGHSKKRIGIVVIAFFLILKFSIAEAVPNIDSWETQNGARVMFIAADSLPMVDIRVVFSAGSARNADQPGLALLTNTLMVSGAGKLSVDDIAEKLESVGAELGNDALRDMAVLSLRSLNDPDKLETALEIFRLIITQPTFPAADLERDRQRLLLSLKHRQQQPESVVKEAFYQAVFGTHPYASPTQGTEASVNAIKREDLLNFYKRYYVARNATIAIVGKLNREQAETLANELISALPDGEKPPAIPAVPALQEPSEKRIELPTTQTHILLGQPGMHRGDKDYFNLYVGNHILGGSGFASRLMQEIREDRGLAYSVYSYFIPMAADGPFQTGMQTRNDQAEEALTLLRDNIRRFIDEGPSADELERAVQNITGGFPLKTDSNKKLVEYLAMIGFYKLPLDYLKTFNDNVNKVTVKSIQSTFKRRIDPDKLAVVMVGGVADKP